MRAHGRWMRAIALAGLLCAATVWAREDEADTEAHADEAVGQCVATCESQHDACVAATKAREADCERQKATCDRGCALFTRMYGPQVVYCVGDCETCRAKLAASPCAKASPDGADCTHAFDACLERCGP